MDPSLTCSPLHERWCSPKPRGSTAGNLAVIALFSEPMATAPRRRSMARHARGRILGRRLLPLIRAGSRHPPRGLPSSSPGTVLFLELLFSPYRCRYRSEARGSPGTVLETFIRVHQIFEGRIGFRVCVADLLVVHLGQHVDVFLAEIVLRELGRHAFAKRLRRHLPAVEARIVGDARIRRCTRR